MDSKGKRSRSPSKKLHGAARLAQSELDELDIGIIRSCKRHQPESDGSSLSRLSITLDGSVTSGEQCEACPMDMMPSEPMRSPSSTGHTMSSLGCSESDSGCMTVSSLPQRGYGSSSLKSPRQKSRHRHSPLKTTSAHGKRHSTPPSKPYLSRLAAAVEARETMPISPNDSRYPRDLRKAALLRSVAQRLELTGQQCQHAMDRDKSPPCQYTQPREETPLPDSPCIARRMPFNCQDDMNLGAAFRNLGFASPLTAQKCITRPCLAGKELPKSSQPFPPA